MTKDFQKTVHDICLGFAAGLATGLMSVVSWHRHCKKLSDSLLQEIKRLFLKEGAIEGAWIESTPRWINWQGARHCVFCGGIARKEAHEVIRYQFIFDAATKELLDLKKEADA